MENVNGSVDGGKQVKKSAGRKPVSKRKIVSILVFVLLFALYVLTELGSRNTASSKELFMIGSHPMPVSSLAGVFSSISTIILIAWVVFYRKTGFYLSLVILATRFFRLSKGLIDFHGTSLPAIFITLVAFVSVILIYQRNEKIQKIQEKSRNELEEFSKSIIGAFANCIDGKDSYTNGHSQRVAKYTKLLAQKLGESPETIVQYYNIALLHDIGKIGIPEAILTKSGKLTDEEFKIMKSHAQKGYEILKNVKIHENISSGAHYHHERFDGKGYPDGLSGYSIPWVARIISVADAFDAMSSTRSYRDKLPMDYIIGEIQKGSGTQFDPSVVEAFMELYNEGAFDDVKETYIESSEKVI